MEGMPSVSAENREGKSEYSMIQQDAIDKLDLKIKNEKSPDVPNDAKIKQFEVAIESIERMNIDDFAEENNWNARRDEGDVDDELATELVKYVLESVPSKLN